MPSDASVAVPGIIGDGPNSGLDVDLYAVTLNAGDTLAITQSSAFYSHVRVFNASGAELTALSTYVSQNTTSTINMTAAANGTYYVGISGYYNTPNDPTKAASGNNSGYTGNTR